MILHNVHENACARVVWRQQVQLNIAYATGILHVFHHPALLLPHLQRKKRKQMRGDKIKIKNVSIRDGIPTFSRCVCVSSRLYSQPRISLAQRVQQINTNVLFTPVLARAIKIHTTFHNKLTHRLVFVIPRRGTEPRDRRFSRNMRIVRGRVCVSTDLGRVLTPVPIAGFESRGTFPIFVSGKVQYLNVYRFTLILVEAARLESE